MKVGNDDNNINPNYPQGLGLSWETKTFLYGGIMTWFPGGELFVIVTSDTIHFYDSKTGKCLRVTSSPITNINSASFFRNGVWLAVAGQKNKSINFNNVVNGNWRNLIKVAHNKPVTSLAFSPIERKLASGSSGGEVKIREISNKLNVNKIVSQYNAHNKAVLSLSWSPDGTMLAAGSEERSISLWDAQSGEYLIISKDNNSPIKSLSWSPDCRLLAFGYDDNTVKIMEIMRPLSSCKLRLNLKGNTHGIITLSFSVDGNFLASSDESGRTLIWRTDSWANIISLDDSSFTSFHPKHPYIFTESRKDKEHCVSRLLEYDVQKLLSLPSNR